METTAPSLRADPGRVRAVLETLAERIGPRKFNAWFRHGTRLSIEGGYVKVAVPNAFAANWIDAHYREEITRAVGEHLEVSAPVAVMVDPSLSGELRHRQLDRQAELVHHAAEGRARAPQRPGPALRHRLEDFVVGDSNRLAYSAASAVAAGEARPFSHLFLHGPCGVGKTHLLQGICAAAGAARGGRRLAWRYVTGEQFTNEFVLALRQKRTSAFRERYRRLDLLAIDDVHFLAAKKATQEEFLHTFNAIQSAGRRLVLASDAHPKLVGELNDQLVSRFVAGMVVKIDPPGRALRERILQRRAAAMKLTVDPAVITYIALHIRGSVRELEGALVKLAAVAALNGSPITIALVNAALADHLARAGSAVTLGDIEAATAAFFGITPADLHSSRRTKTVSAARMVVMYLARHHTRMSYPEIARATGKNHSSVIQAVQRLERLLGDGGRIEWLTPAGAKAMPADLLLRTLTEQFA
jgi:chromosomal replication initiator protein